MKISQSQHRYANQYFSFNELENNCIFLYDKKKKKMIDRFDPLFYSPPVCLKIEENGNKE